MDIANSNPNRQHFDINRVVYHDKIPIYTLYTVYTVLCTPYAWMFIQYSIFPARQAASYLPLSRFPALAYAQSASSTSGSEY